jgi:hypothetical protein
MTLKMGRVVSVLVVVSTCSIVVASIVWEREKPSRKRIGSPRYELPNTFDLGAGFHDDPVEFIGHTETAIVEKYGIPNLRGHYGPPSPLLDALALVYRCRSGELYLWFREQHGKMTCFSSAWLPKGAVF